MPASQNDCKMTVAKERAFQPSVQMGNLFLVFYNIIKASPLFLLRIIFQFKMQTKSTSSDSSIESPSDKNKFTSEDIFKYVNFGVTFILLFCVKGFLQFRAYCQSKGYYVFSVDSLQWVAVGFSFIYVTKYSYYHFMRNRLHQIINSKYQGETRDKKTTYCLKLSYDACFYSFTTIVAYIFFRQEYWFPSIIGGCGQCSKLYKDYPNWPDRKRTELEIYFLFQLGVHAFSVFEMVVIKRKTERKFHEYLLHHFIAVSLILFSLMSNQMLPGAMILVVHDMSDILVAGCRAYLETIYETKVRSAIAYVSLMAVWIFCRILVFPVCLLANVFVNAPLSTDQWSIIGFEYRYLLSMACVLYLMHLYWTFYLMKVGINAIISKKMVNVHQKLKE